MQTIQVKTGFGYYKDAQGRIVAKAELPIGQHPLSDGYTYSEVADGAALAAVQIWQDPAEIERQQNEQKIQTKIRSMAIAELIKENELPAGTK